MKKIVILMFVSLFTLNVVDAKKKTKKTNAPKIVLTDSKDINDVMKFDSELFDFGTIEEGPQATHVFKFTNYGKEPLVVQGAQPSCGCTVPSFDKEPVAAGATGVIKAVYNTQGRPNAFTKTITVTTNMGKKVLTIKGNVTPAPKASTPSDNSLLKNG